MNLDKFKRISIVSNSSRTILNLTEIDFVYIPLTKEEINKFNCRNIIQPCFRLEFEK